MYLLTPVTCRCKTHLYQGICWPLKPVGARPTCTKVSADSCNLSVQDPPVPRYLRTPEACQCKTHLYQGIWWPLKPVTALVQYAPVPTYLMTHATCWCSCTHLYQGTWWRQLSWTLLWQRTQHLGHGQCSSPAKKHWWIEISLTTSNRNTAALKWTKATLSLTQVTPCDETSTIRDQSDHQKSQQSCPQINQSNLNTNNSFLTVILEHQHPLIKDSTPEFICESANKRYCTVTNINTIICRSKDLILNISQWTT